MPTYTVGPSGRDFTTITGGIQACSDNPATRGDMGIVVVDPGTYTEVLDFRSTSGGWTIPCIVRAADPNNRPVVASTGAASATLDGGAYRGTAAGEVTLEDLEFSGWTNASNGVVYVTAVGLIVRRCKFIGNTGRICIRWCGSSASRYGIVEQNEFYTSGSTGAGTNGVVLAWGSLTQVKNNKAVMPANVQFLYEPTAGPGVVEHNSLLFELNMSGLAGVLMVGSFRGNLIKNLGSAASYGIYNWGGTNYYNFVNGTFATPFTGTDAGGNSTTDPLFTDTGTGDLTLQSGSAAIRAVTRSANTLVDILGVSRSDPTDLGAYETSLGTTVSSVTMPTSTSVKLTLAALVTNDSTWTNAANYTITPPGGAPAITVSAAAVTDAGMSITLTVNEHVQGGSYNVAWAGLTAVTDGNMGYTGVGTAPTLVSASFNLSNRVVLTFSESMTNNAALTTLSNYSIVDVTAGGVISKTLVQRISATVVWVTVSTSSPFIGGRVYRFGASNITDLAGNTVSAATVDATRTSIVRDLDAAYAYGVYQTVDIEFDAPVDPSVSAVDLAATYVFSRQAPLLAGSTTPTVVTVTCPNPSDVVTLLVTGMSSGQNYRCSIAATAANNASTQDFVGVDADRKVTVSGAIPRGNWGGDT